MKSVLYIISKSDQAWPDYRFILAPQDDDVQKTIVFLRKVGLLEQLPAEQVYQLDEALYDELKGSVSNDHPAIPDHFPSVSYRRLLDLIFSSDHSVVI